MAEVVARTAFDFPLYAADNKVGYWLKPDQHGTFGFTNDWAFNSDSMGVAEEFMPSEKLDVLLVGDSVVFGGNPLRQDEKLGPMIKARTGWQVWPAAAGSWGLQNELAFLRGNTDLVAGADVIVFVFNSADFDRPSEWKSPYSHPRERPALFLPYLFRRYVLKEGDPPTSPLPVAPRNNLADWTRFVEAAGKPVIAVSYANSLQTGQNCNWVPAAMQQVATWSCYDGFALGGPAAFRDVIHPTPAGNAILAERIIRLVQATGPARSGT